MIPTSSELNSNCAPLPTCGGSRLVGLVGDSPAPLTDEQMAIVRSVEEILMAAAFDPDCSTKV